MSALGDDWDVQVDTVGFLANNLRGYEPTSILREQLQNADDASHEQGRRGELRLHFLADRLVIVNPSVFTDEDWRRLRRPNSRGKVRDSEQTGEFGVGFWGALHLTDTPIVTSGGRQVVFEPPRATPYAIRFLDGTQIELPYRRQPTRLGETLDASVVTTDVEYAMVKAFVDQMAELLLFTRAIDAISIELPDGRIRRATRTVERIADNVDRLTVDVAGEPAERCIYLTVGAVLPNPPPGRHGRITVALPITLRHRGPGRAFFMFPTETESGLHLSIDAHFRATDDRRSLENSGEQGEWNDRIFEAAGQAVGRSLDVVLDPEVHGLDHEDAVAWFSDAGSHLRDIARRARLLTWALDHEARVRAAVPDRSGVLRRAGELVDVPSAIEPILGEAVAHAARPARREETRAVYRRWGLATWGAAETARWLKANVPSVRTPVEEAPDFVRDAQAVLVLLDFCKGQEHVLHESALLLGTDGAYHPIGSGLARPSEELRHLVTGLARPLVHQSFLGSWAARLAPKTTALWLREALIESTDRLVGKKAPVHGIGAAGKRQHISEAIAVVRSARDSLESVPLALDEAGFLQVFDDTVVVGLPDAERAKAAQLARRLGRTPLHRSIDEEARGAGDRFGVSLLAELVPEAAGWDSVVDSRLLVDVLGVVAKEGATSPSLIDRLREMKIWQGSDGCPHTLADLRLPAQHRAVRSTRLLLADSLVGDANPSSPVFATFRDLLRVDVLDMTEEVVLACENPPAALPDQRALLIELGDCDRLSSMQQERLRDAAFVLCRDRRLRRPADVLLTSETLPLDLDGRRVDDEARVDRRVRERLGELGAPELPSAADLLRTAGAIEHTTITPDGREPGRILWDHLVRCHDKYPKGTLGELGTVPWLATTPGPKRRKPGQCYDPSLSFAAPLFPVPQGVATPPQGLSDALKIRSTLETEDCVRLGQWSTEAGVQLDRAFFQYIDRRCRRGPSDQRRIAALRSARIIPLGTGAAEPRNLVSAERAPVWGHLRQPVDAQFVEDFPNLVEAWGIAAAGEVGWQDHLDVLDELARLDDLDSLDRKLAAARIGSLAALELDEHQFETLRRRLHLLTSMGMRRCEDALRSDLPPAVVERLASWLPVVEESSEISGLLDRLAIRSLRETVTLLPIVDGVHDERRWADVLRVQARNVVRFLKASDQRLEPRLLAAWPPVVKGVRSLAVHASVSGVDIEWPATAHLAGEGDELVLYVRAGGQLTAQDVVDAIAFQFAVDRGRKSLLLLVLQAPSAEAGAQQLDWDTIPALTEEEDAYFHDQDPGEVLFPEPPRDRTSDDDPSEVDVDEAAAGLAEDVPVDADPTADFPPDTAPPEVDAAPAGMPVPAGGNDGVVHRDDPEAVDRELLRSPRGTTDFEALEAMGYSIKRDLDEKETTDEDYRPPQDERDDEPARDELRLCLSFFDVSNGVLPIEARHLNWLTSDVALREVHIFGELVPARPVGARHIRIEGGPTLFARQQVVAGTVVRAHPSAPGSLEIEIRPDPHHVDGVWMLELGEDGRLERLRQDDIELRWETDDRFYRSERRLEDIQALMLDGGKSALQLVIEAFHRRPGEGMTVDEVWDLVAINRLFAEATIRNHLSTQKELFTNRDGLWFMDGDEIRSPRARSRVFGTDRPASRGATGTSTGTLTAPSDVMKAARRLSRLLQDVDRSTLEAVVQVLGIRDLIDETAFVGACEQYVTAPSSTLLAAIERDLQADPNRGVIAARALDGCRREALERARPLLDLIGRYGSAAATQRAHSFLARLESTAAHREGDPLDVVTRMLEAYEDGVAADAELSEWIGRMWSQRPHGDPLHEAAAWLDELLHMERAHRRATRLGGTGELAVEARNQALGWINAQLPAEVYSEPEVQRLRAVLDLLCARPSREVVDGLYQLGLLASQAPGAGGDAALLFALVSAHAQHTAVTALVVDRAEREVDRLTGGSAPTSTTERFVETWSELAYLPMNQVLARLG